MILFLFACLWFLFYFHRRKLNLQSRAVQKREVAIGGEWGGYELLRRQFDDFLTFNVSSVQLGGIYNTNVFVPTTTLLDNRVSITICVYPFYPCVLQPGLDTLWA